MTKKNDNKTRPEGLNIADYLNAVEPADKRADCHILHDMMRRVSGEEAILWGAKLPTAIVGYGQYHYRYATGREGDFMRTGFAARAANITIYVMPGYQDFGEELARLGKHKMGKSCLYIKRLSDVDMAVLEEIVAKGLAIMARLYPE